MKSVLLYGALLYGALLAGLAGLAAAQTFEVAEASIADLQKAMTGGRVTSKALVQAYLNRIQAFDTQGPRLRAMITLNPEALRQAETLDRERAAKGPRGPLHGIPVIVKDNYNTTDMPTTAGSIAMQGYVPKYESFQVKKLREAGAVIIGKSNMHELASGITTISSVGGQTLNPYDPGRYPGGSSGGTGAAIAASFAAIGMGSDTCGSIRIPASENNLVGLRPTKGLSSIAGIVPLASSQDVGGPLARSTADLAVVLDATLGEDPDDAATHLQAGQRRPGQGRPGEERPGFLNALKTGSLKGMRLGILEPLFGDATDDKDMLALVRAAIEDLKKQGAEAVALPMPDLTATVTGSSVIDLEFKEDLAAYYARNGKALAGSLAEIVEKGLYHLALEARFRGILAAQGRDSDAYRAATAKRVALRKMILQAMEEQHLDALVYPTMRRKPALLGDPQPGSTCQLSAATGFPALSMPAGFTPDGLPAGVELLGRPFDDAKLLAMGYDYEQATHHRKAPSRTPALGKLARPAVLSWTSTSTKTAMNSGVTTKNDVKGKYSFDPATNLLTYALSGQAGTLTLHRGVKLNDAPGPVIAVLDKLTGSETLSTLDGEKLMSGELYLRLATGQGEAIRIALKPR